MGQVASFLVLGAEDSTRFELVYRLGYQGRIKSIIGTLIRGIDGAYLLDLAPTLKMQGNSSLSFIECFLVCVSYGEIANPTLIDTIVLTEVDKLCF